jgi:hypothetical protein
MNPNHDRSLTNVFTRAAFVLCAGLAIVAMSVSLGNSTTVEKTGLNVPALDASGSLAMDAAVFGSSAGQASIKSAPTTWSSRSAVRWNARWANDARYVV